MPKKHRSSRLTSIVGQPPVVHVKQEPSLLPRLDSPPSLGQEAGAASGRQPQVGAGGHAVTQGLQVGAEVKVGGEEERQLLGTQAAFRWGEEDSESWQRKASFIYFFYIKMKNSQQHSLMCPSQNSLIDACQ